jgi:hypothetical protein
MTGRYFGEPLPQAQLEAAASDPLRPVVKNMLLEAGRPMSILELYDMLAGAGHLKPNRDARVYPQHPVRIRIACVVANLYHAGELAGMDAA